MQRMMSFPAVAASLTSTSPVRARFAPAGLLLLAILLLAPTVLSAQGVELRWKFDAGDEHLYEMVQTSMTAVPGGGDVNQVQTMRYRQSVTDVDAEGVATVRLVYEAIQVDAQTPEGSMSYDSESDEEAGDPSFMALGQMVGQTFEIRVTSDGTVLSVTGSDEMLAGMMDQDLPPEVQEMMSQTFGDEGMVDMMQQAFQTLPEGAMDEGDTWESDLSVALPFGTITSDYVYTLEALSYERGRQVARIAVDGNMGELEMDPDSPMAGMLQSTGGPISGHMVFDLELGQVVESSIVSEVNLSAMGQQITTTTTVDVRRLEN